ncbi:apolipoprotein M [Thunnus thynnus]|uniref:apolipoprotein M n=1 Tax=Thunnus maccoyii TaxID=8240 RepID=UPI001C4D34EC|nr:apolipoprotein M [Thunnus maccoyii]
MLNATLPYLLHLFSLYQSIVPCSVPEQLPANTVDSQQYLGEWYFIAAVSHREADIREYRAMDNVLFTVEETAKNTLLMTGHIRIGENCINQTWIYHIRPERDDLEVEGRPQRRTLLWSGKWVNCSDCIIVQEVEPPVDSTGTEDSLNRHMLYARQSDVDSEMVTAFLKNSACHNMSASVKLPQEKGCCRCHGHLG